MTPKYLVIFISALLILSSCKKQPTAEFTIDKLDYSAGDNVQISNFSKDAVRTVWTIKEPSGASTEIIDNRPLYKVPNLGLDGIYSITLDTYSKKDKKTSTASREFLVKTIRGTLIVRNQQGDNTAFTVKIDNELVNVKPASWVSATIPAGPHYVVVNSASQEWKLTPVITAGGYFEWVIYK